MLSASDKLWDKLDHFDGQIFDPATITQNQLYDPEQPNDTAAPPPTRFKCNQNKSSKGQLILE